MGDDLYGKTTESLESLDNISCTPIRRSTFGRSKKDKDDIELGNMDDPPQKETSELMSSSTERGEPSSSTAFGSKSYPSSSARKEKFQKAVNVVKAKNMFTVQDADKTQRRTERQRQHLQKFSKVNESSQQRTVDGRRPQYQRDNAAKLLFKAGVHKLQTRPTVKKSAFDSFGGRSFLNDDIDDIDDNRYHEANEYNFFDFKSKAEMRDEPPIYKENESEEFTSASSNLKKSASAAPRKKVEKLWVSRLLGNDVKYKFRNKLKSDLNEERIFFTYWLSFVQLIIMIVVLCIYPFAPIGKDTRTVTKEVLLSREGVTSFETLSRKIVESFWLGPSPESLILLGAKYAPCMRRDEKVYAAIEAERRRENSTGCCMQATVADGCIQREKKYCLSPFVEFKKGSVCGQDKQFCKKAYPPAQTWDPYTITSWPKCLAQRRVPQTPENRHMTCTVTGRPCCVNTQGQCVITTENNCKFWNGIYHPDATLCSQVDCLAATCGNTFYNDNQPDQFYRLGISLFLCAGILHLLIVLVFNLTLLRYIEGYAGWWRTATIFLLSGVGGNLYSAILLPYQAEVGESGAMFGVFACIFVEGIQNWKVLEKPWHYIGKLTLILVVAFLFGLLPYVDNTAHIFGFIFGLFLGFMVLPFVPVNTDEEEKKRESKKYWILGVISFFIVIVLFVVGFLLFYLKQDLDSKAIALFNCPLGEKLCRNFNQGIKLESRDIEY